jgi:hypothetical protein
VRRVLAVAVVVVIVVLGVASAAEQPRSTVNPCVDRGNRTPRLPPVDEAPSRPDFLAYLTRLRAAVDRRDIDAVVDAADPKIRLGFDASGGRDALRTLLSGTSESWEELRAALALGGSFSSPTAFAAPYVYSRWPDAFDSFECAAVIGRNVRVRTAARPDAPVITSVSYSIVGRLQSDGDAQWSSVRLGDGRTGFMWHAYVRSPVDYRALFNVIDGQWRMTAFVAGD